MRGKIVTSDLTSVSVTSTHMCARKYEGGKAGKKVGGKGTDQRKKRTKEGRRQKGMRKGNGE